MLVAHAGLDHLSGLRALWAGLPMTGEVRLRWEFVAAADVPREPAACTDWLYEHWAAMDIWVGRHSRPQPLIGPGG